MGKLINELRGQLPLDKGAEFTEDELSRLLALLGDIEDNATKANDTISTLSAENEELKAELREWEQNADRDHDHMKTILRDIRKTIGDVPALAAENEAMRDLLRVLAPHTYRRVKHCELDHKTTCGQCDRKGICSALADSTRLDALIGGGK